MLKKVGLFQRVFANYKIATFIVSLDKFFIKLPHLPKKLRILINKIIPFFTLIIGIIGAVMSLVSGLFIIATLISGNFTTTFDYVSSFFLVLLSSLFLIKAFRPLRKNNAIGWIYLFWAQVIELINLIIGIMQNGANTLFGMLIIAIGLYLLFEIGQFYVYEKDDDNRR